VNFREKNPEKLEQSGNRNFREWGTEG